jgi:hypothetical protein
MKSVIFLFCVFFSVTAYAQGQFESGNQLKAHCDSPHGSFGSIYCLGYIIGIADANSLRVCTPRGATKGQLESIVKKYFNDNPASLHADADVLVFVALNEAFPCQKK